jgi:hypothetical protein
MEKSSATDNFSFFAQADLKIIFGDFEEVYIAWLCVV